MRGAPAPLPTAPAAAAAPRCSPAGLSAANPSHRRQRVGRLARPSWALQLGLGLGRVGCQGVQVTTCSATLLGLLGSGVGRQQASNKVEAQRGCPHPPTMQVPPWPLMESSLCVPGLNHSQSLLAALKPSSLFHCTPPPSLQPTLPRWARLSGPKGTSLQVRAGGCRDSGLAAAGWPGHWVRGAGGRRLQDLPGTCVPPRHSPQMLALAVRLQGGATCVFTAGRRSQVPLAAYHHMAEPALLAAMACCA